MKWICLTLVFSLLLIVVNAQKKAFAVTPKNDQTINDPNFVEEKPSFPGGDKAYARFLSENIRCPCTDDVQGRVIVSFIIEKMAP